MDIVEELRGLFPVERGENDKAYATVEDAAAEIERLRWELAARDAEIAAWLRDWQEVTYAVTGEQLLAADIATAIASGQYRKDGE